MEATTSYFKENIVPKIEKYYSITFSTFIEENIIGLGNLDRFEIEGDSFLGGVEFWSRGWLGIHLINLTSDDEIFNILISPDQNIKKIEMLKKLEDILLNPDLI